MNRETFWHQNTKRWFALLVIAVIPFGMMIWIRIRQTGSFTTNELIAYPILFGGSSILLLWLIKKYFLKESLQDFNPGKGYFLRDWLLALGLTAIYFLLFYLERWTLYGILSFRSNEELLGLMLDMRENTLLLVLWFGPVLWVGIALYEELVRVFMLSTLWKFAKGKGWLILAMVITSVLIGLSHWSQGSYGIVTIAIKSMAACLFFHKFGRLLPLVIAHALYDGLQVALLLITYPA